MQGDSQRPYPYPVNRFYDAYFAGLAQRRILVPMCRRCGTKQFPHPETCRHCFAIDFDWVEVDRTARVYTYSVVYRAFQPWFAQQVPYGVVVADIGEGLRLVGACFGGDVERLSCGDIVEAEFVPVGEVTVLQWHRVSATAGENA